MNKRPALRFFCALAIAVLILLFPACSSSKTSTQPPTTPSGPAPQLLLSPFVSGLASPVDLQMPDDGTGSFFVAEQPGTIRIIDHGNLLATPFLDIHTKVDFSGEKGLLGLAFHPNFKQNRRFFVNYVFNGASQSRIAEYLASSTNANLGDPTSERILLTVSQPFPNHKGGQLVFGPDGFLYIGFGDGGSEGDPLGNGQNKQTLLGKMLRIDVDHTTGSLPYGIPADNPFASGGGLPEIYAYGLRNPWRFSFDLPTGRLFVADVGQDKYEEIDLLTKGGNFGWNIMEGMHCFNPATGCNMNSLILPIAEYDHSEGEAVIGGHVYRGSAIPALVGTYLLSDFASGKIWGLQENPPGTWTRTQLAATGRMVSSFGQDLSGEQYLLDYSGSVLKVVAQ
jgi:glucose/arabinose dehydrogenase